jgi:hypothetical protein
MVSNTPSPTMIPWSRALIEGSSGDCSNCPFSHVLMPQRYADPGLGSRPLIG